MHILFAHSLLFFFFFNDTATTEIYTLSLHDALPIIPKSPQRQITTHSARLHKTGTPNHPVSCGPAAVSCSPQPFLAARSRFLQPAAVSFCPQSFLAAHCLLFFPAILFRHPCFVFHP